MTTVHKNSTAFGANPRRQRREHKTLLSVLRGNDGAIDLASIMAGVLVIGIVGGVISATVFAVVPWSQNEAAKADLAAVRTAEAVYQTTHNSWGSLNDLHTATTISSASGGAGGPGQPGASVAADITSTPLLPDSGLPTVITNSDAGYIAAVTSDTGTTFYLSNLSANVVSDPAAVVVPDGLTVPTPPTAAWNIPDPALRNIILWTLGKSQTDALTIGDAADLTSIKWASINGTVDPSWGGAFSVWTELRSVRDLTGIEAATNLTDLTLQNSQVSNLAPISGLAKLTTLDLSNTAVTDSDLAQISGLPLTTLDLSNTAVTDLAPISGLPLTELSFTGDRISNLTPLAGMGQLAILNAQGGLFTDLSPLSSLKNLWLLSMDNGQVTDLTPLHNLTGLQDLEVSNTPLSSLAGVEGLTGLLTLSAGDTGVSDLTPVAGLTSLLSLQLNFTAATDLTPIAGLTSLASISLNFSAVSDLTPIAGLRNVADLEIGGSQVHDLTPLAGWPVGHLGASETSITDWSPVAGWSVYK